LLQQVLHKYRQETVGLELFLLLPEVLFNMLAEAAVVPIL
jgi:hypothetical protein